MIAVHQIAVKLNILVLTDLNGRISSVWGLSRAFNLGENGAGVAVDQRHEFGREFAVAVLDFD